MILYTDGAYSSTTKIGGWAVVEKKSNNFILVKKNATTYTTSNRMELTALLFALKLISQNKNEHHTIFTDSAYISNCFKDKWYIKWQSNGWINAAKEPVKNSDLWIEIFKYYKDFENKPKIIKVKGHSGNEGNEKADYFATLARERYMIETQKESDKLMEMIRK